MTMKIGIYNRWLHTIGGGERYTLSMAEHLARSHEVEVFSHQLVDRADLERRLHVDLSRVTLRFLPLLPEEELSAYTSRFDLFVNATFQSLLPSRAPRNLLVVYFPTPLHARATRRLRRWLVLLAKRWLIVPEFVEGFYAPDRLGRTEFRWMSQHGRIRIPVPDGRQSMRLDLVVGRPLGPTVSGTRLVCSANGRHLTTIQVPSTGAVFSPQSLYVEQMPAGAVSLDLEVAEPVQVPQDPRRLGVGVLDVRIHDPRYWVYYVLFRRLFPRLGYRLEAVREREPDPRRGLATYDTVCVISRYAQTWTDRYWGVPTHLLYPPIPLHLLAPGPKKRRILSVGRFFWGSHNKKHLDMVRVFSDLHRRGDLPGWELHLAGSTTPGPSHQTYLERVRAASLSAPVRLHTDVDFNTLRTLYAESQIYWHACGYGEDPVRAPERFEHFGITTVEAMAAGCVPIVIAKGGQTEIVRHGIDGFLWNDLDELRRFTVRVAGDESLARDLGSAAVAGSERFSTQAFRRRLDEILATP